MVAKHKTAHNKAMDASGSKQPLAYGKLPSAKATCNFTIAKQIGGHYPAGGSAHRERGTEK